MLKYATALLFSLFIAQSISLGGTVFSERLNYKIIVPQNASKVEQFAAQELSKYLEEIYDADIRLNDSSSDITFFIAVSYETIQAGFINIPDLKTNFGVFRKNRSFLFYGYDDIGVEPEKNHKGHAGTLASVYYFLNHYVGVNFLFPGENGHRFSKNSGINFNKEQDIPIPSFKLRSVSMRTKAYSKEEMNLFLRRMLGNVPYWSTHDYNYVFLDNWKKRFWETNPEFFMLRGGKRVSESYPYHIPCLSNPDVIRQTAADIVENLNRNENLKTIKLFCDAPISRCQCERCSQSKERSCAKADESNEEVYGFQKKVAEIVRQSHPDINFLTQTKGDSYKTPPELITLGDYFTLALLVPRVNPQSDFQKYVELAKEWKKAGTRMILKSYPRYDGKTFANYPLMTPCFTVNYFRMFKDSVEGADNSELLENIPYCFSALGQYVQLKALFDISLSAEKLVDEFCSLAYRGAEAEMAEFYIEMDKLFMKRNSSTGDPLLDAYYPDNLNRPMALLKIAATKIAPSCSPHFDDLYQNFTEFYNHCQEQKEEIDNVRDHALVQVKLPYLEKGSELNGDPESWTGALKVPFMPLKKDADFQMSNLYILCSEKDLNIGLVANEKDIKNLKTDCEITGEGAIWDDDCFEIMFNPDSTANSYYQIIVNSHGVYRIFKHETGIKTQTLGDLKPTINAALDSDKWLVTMRIPLEQFPQGLFKETWRFNAFRTRVLKDRMDKDFQCSGIILLSRSYHVLLQYAQLIWPESVHNN